jgi:hypothetical protein
MAIDPHYIPAFSIEDVLLDKDTGAPLSGGKVYFEQDNQRGVLKPVYQITGTSPNYTYTQLPNPMTLSSIGTFEDSLGNPVIPYFFPYDSNFDVEYYYIRVTSSEDVEQFTREAQPYISLQESNEVLSVITNELSNPQFIEVLFDTSSGSYTYNVNGVVDSVINIAPDWDLIVSAPSAGTVTVSQLKPSGSLNILTNPGTLLTISSAGLTKLQLRQRIFGSPNLWGSGYLSASFVAKTYSGTAVSLNMYYTQSSGTVIDQLLVSASLPASGAYGSFPGSALIPASNSVGNFPSAYIDVYFEIPLSIQIDITSVMVASTGATSIENIAYDQESLPRQIDHLYHYAYPIIPIGGLLDFAGFADPLHYYLCNGAAKNRISDYKLFTALTKTEVVTLTLASPTFTVVSNADYHIGMPLEGIGISPGTTIANIVGTTITMSSNAIAPAGAQIVRFFAWGAGDGSTTFNVPNLLGYATAGANGTTLGAGVVNGVGLQGGAANAVLVAANVPAHTHKTTVPVQGVAFGFGYANGTETVSQTFTSDGGESLANIPLTTPPTGFSIVQPTAMVKKYIRYQ